MTKVKHSNPDSMHKSPVFSQCVIIPAEAQTVIVGGQIGVDDKGEGDIKSAFNE
jgi:hypothetical protein